MASEFFINSQELENKVRSLLPSQGGAGAGFDLSASTQIIPIIDLTESAEGSDLRQDLQTALSHGTVTAFSVTDTTTTLISNTGYYRVFGVANINHDAYNQEVNFSLYDGVTSKKIWGFFAETSGTTSSQSIPFDFNVFLEAGDTFRATTTNTDSFAIGSTRQIATIDGILVNP
jgi:hypothetical protein